MQTLWSKIETRKQIGSTILLLFDRRTPSALMLLGVVHCTSAAEEPLPPDQAFWFRAS